MGDPTLDLYVGTLVPAQFDRTRAGVRRAAIEAALRSSSLQVASMFESGSWSHGTSIKAKSDVDYMAVAVGPRPIYPSSALTSAKAAITGCDWNIASTAVSSPVVKVTYYSEPHFEIAPTWFKEARSGHSVYWIAGRRDEWVLSAPGAHLAYVNKQNDRLGKKVKPIVRLLKAWKYHVTAPVSSFYLEMRAAEYAANESSIIYDIDLRRCLRKIISAEARDMNDPQGIVGRIPACSSDERRRQALRQMTTALSNLELAEAARLQADAGAYWAAMSDVFGATYPWPRW